MTLSFHDHALLCLGNRWRIVYHRLLGRGRDRKGRTTKRAEPQTIFNLLPTEFAIHPTASAPLFPEMFKKASG